MKSMRKIEIVVETRRILTIRRGSRYCIDHCEACGEQARMVTVDEAAILAVVSPRAIYQLVEARKLHYVETTDREVLICLHSLGNLS
jgi:hypothetical protein